MKRALTLACLALTAAGAVVYWTRRRKEQRRRPGSYGICGDGRPWRGGEAEREYTLGTTGGWH